MGVSKPIFKNENKKNGHRGGGEESPPRILGGR